MELCINVGLLHCLSNIDQTSQSSVSLVVDSEEPEILEVAKPRTDKISEEDMRY